MRTTLAHGTYTKETPTKNYPLKFQKSMNSNKLEKDLKKKKKVSIHQYNHCRN